MRQIQRNDSDRGQMKYRITRGFLAIDGSRRQGRFQIGTLTTGSVIEVIGSVQRSGLVDVIYYGDRAILLAVFMSEIEERAEHIPEAAIATA